MNRLNQVLFLSIGIGIGSLWNVSSNAFAQEDLSQSLLFDEGEELPFSLVECPPCPICPHPPRPNIAKIKAALEKIEAYENEIMKKGPTEMYEEQMADEPGPDAEEKPE